MDALETIESREPAAAIYSALSAALDGVGPHNVEVKKTSLHVTRRRAFLGVHPRAAGMLVNVVLERELTGERVARTDHVSRNRWHNEILLAPPGDVDSELTSWIAEAYSLAE